MSLYLTIKQVTNIRLQGQIKIEPKMSLMIENSKLGAILVSKMRFNRLRWEEDYQFVSDVNENVDFVLVKGEEKQAQFKENIMGRGKLYTKKFVKMFQKSVQQKQKRNEPFEYQITLYKESNKQQVIVGTVQMHVTIDKQKRFQGQVIASSDLDLRGQVQSNPKFVKFYLGKSSKINLFSLCDEKADQSKFRFLQSIYKDLQ